MTNRINALSVALEEDIREDDAQATIEAIKQIKGVLHVTPNVADIGSWTAEMRVKSELFQAITRIFWPQSKEGSGHAGR